MSALRITLDISDRVSTELRAIADGLQDKAPLHAQIAADAEAFVKARGAATAAREHKTATRLGATPTGHLEDAYRAIEGQSSATEALLLVPAAGRLAAAFGPVTIRPKKSKYLTIPVAKDSYGKRAGEFGGNLIFLRVGPKKQAVLARRQKSTDESKPLEVLYILARESKIPEDRNLIPFEALADEALDSTEEYLDGLLTI
jgi:hypothetical protein